MGTRSAATRETIQGGVRISALEGNSEEVDTDNRDQEVGAKDSESEVILLVSRSKLEVVLVAFII